jgi:5-formyltetrahydrofolate cyclo-ligase
MLSKKNMRNEPRARRVALSSALPDFAERIVARAPALNLPDNCIVGGYVALPGEADPNLLLKHLEANGHAIAFPRVTAKGEALAFHLWHAGRMLSPGAFGIPEPSPDWPLATPRALLVPLLAFDSEGFRIGYGGGFYDRTLAELSEKGQVLAIGIAFAGQRVEHIPRDVNDRRLDMVVTEAGIENFG